MYDKAAITQKYCNPSQSEVPLIVSLLYDVEQILKTLDILPDIRSDNSRVAENTTQINMPQQQLNKAVDLSKEVLAPQNKDTDSSTMSRKRCLHSDRTRSVKDHFESCHALGNHVETTSHHGMVIHDETMGNIHGPSQKHIKSGQNCLLQPEQRGFLNLNAPLAPHQANYQDTLDPSPKPNIKDRKYCTQTCLLGLTSTSPIPTPLDPNCPNFPFHPPQHPDPQRFLRHLQRQLSRNGRNSSCIPLNISGTRSALFKIVSRGGYTFLGKAFRKNDDDRRINEVSVYEKLQALQGREIPVCIGSLELGLGKELKYEGREYDSMILLSYGGEGIPRNFEDVGEKVGVIGEAERILGLVHGMGVLHCDAGAANWVRGVDEVGRGVMLVDFERAGVLRGGSREEDERDARRCEVEMGIVRAQLEGWMG